MAQMFATPGYCMVLPAMDWIDATRPPNVAVACATGRDDGSHAFVIGAQAICPTLLSTSCSHRSKSRAYSYTFLILVHHTLFSAQSPEASDTSEPGCPQQKLKEQWETIRSVLENRAGDLANAQVTCVNC